MTEYPRYFERSICCVKLSSIHSRTLKYLSLNLFAFCTSSCKSFRIIFYVNSVFRSGKYQSYALWLASLFCVEFMQTLCEDLIHLANILFCFLRRKFLNVLF